MSAQPGALHFSKGEFERALNNFEFKDTIPGMLGRGVCKYHLGKYEVLSFLHHRP